MLVTVITDASYCPETKAAGFGYWAVSQRMRKYGGGPLRELPRNSQEAEMLAIVNAVIKACESGVAEAGDEILIQSDCLGALNTFEGKRTRVADWEQGIVDGLAVFGIELNLFFRYRHVKGHTNGATPRLWVNNLCDKHAKEGMRERRSQLK